MVSQVREEGVGVASCGEDALDEGARRIRNRLDL